MRPPIQRHGFGEHAWEIDASAVQQLLYWCKYSAILLIFALAHSTRFYLWIFLRFKFYAYQNLDSAFLPTRFPTRTFRLLCWAVMAFCMASGITFIFTIFFHCQPISHAWNRDLKGTCINYRSVAYANGGINILQDILIMLLPVYEIRILQLSARKKVGVYAMFGLGLM
jgi:hypothetical protein